MDTNVSEESVVIDIQDSDKEIQDSKTIDTKENKIQIQNDVVQKKVILKWSEEEDEALALISEKHKGKNWLQITQELSEIGFKKRS